MGFRCLSVYDFPATLLSFPSGDLVRAGELARELVNAGVSKLCVGGPSRVLGYSVLGRGHAAVVVAGVLEGVGLVAVKVRREDSKRDSLMLECRALEASWPVAPRVYRCTDEFIVMDLVEGSPINEIASSVRGCDEAVALIAKVAEAARWLDRVGVCHEELSDLRGHAFIVGNGVIKFIDFESASMRFCCTVCKVLSWALHRSPLTKACPTLADVRDIIRNVLKVYKRNPGRAEFLTVIRVLVADLLETLMLK